VGTRHLIALALALVLVGAFAGPASAQEDSSGLTAAAAASPMDVLRLGTVGYTFTVRNGSSSDTARAVSARITVPDEPRSVSSKSCTSAPEPRFSRGRVLTCALGDIAPGASASISVSVPRAEQYDSGYITTGSAQALVQPRVHFDEEHACAAANTVTGTARGELLSLGRFGDRLFGVGGEDKLYGGRGDDCLYGGTGNDLLRGGIDRDRLYGGPGNDLLDGYADGDRLYGGLGNDTLKGGSGVNTYQGGPGRDYVDSFNGRLETVDCGRGRDRVVADKHDTLRHCEKVSRKHL
jgi:hypothetical protein